MIVKALASHQYQQAQRCEGVAVSGSQNSEHPWRAADELAIRLEMERRIGIYLSRPRVGGGVTRNAA